MREAAARFARWPRALLVTFIAGATLALLLSATPTKSPPVWVGAASWVVTLLVATCPVAGGKRMRRRRQAA